MGLPQIIFSVQFFSIDIVLLIPFSYFIVIHWTWKEICNINNLKKFINKVNDFDGFTRGVIIKNKSVVLAESF